MLTFIKNVFRTNEQGSAATFQIFSAQETARFFSCLYGTQPPNKHDADEAETFLEITVRRMPRQAQ